MKAIFLRIIKDRRKSLLIYFLVSVIFLWMYIAIFPYIQSQSQELQQLMQAYPESLLKAFNIKISELTFTELEPFLAMEHFSAIWPILLIALAISLAGGAIGGEIEKGTIEILLSQPLSRAKLFLGKYLGALFLILIFVLFSIISIFPLAWMYNVELQVKNYFTFGILGFFFGWVVFSLGILTSSIFSEKGKANFLAAGIVVVMYGLNIISSLKENLENLKFFSFFHYYDASAALINNKVDNLSFIVFAIVILITSILAGFWFSKRDIATS